MTKHSTLPRRVLAIASGGGHWIQLLRLRPAFSGLNVSYATVDSTSRGDIEPSPFYRIPDANRTQKFRLMLLLMRLAWILLRVRPQAIVTTGAELIPPGRSPGPAEIRDSNGPMLQAMAREMGLEQPPHLHAADRLEAILEALEEAGDRDIVLLSGGVSAGKYDLVPDALERFGAGRIFHRVAQKPGRPLLLARKGSQLFFGLPGNPVSCHLCFHRYVGAAIRQMEGRTPLADPVSGQLTAAVQPRRSRTRFVLARTERLHRASTDWQIHPLSGTSSADMFACCRANCYVEVPPGEAEIRSSRALRPCCRPSSRVPRPSGRHPLAS